MDCRGGMGGPLVSRLDHLTASPFGGAARVVILDGTATDTGRVNWTLGLTDLAGRPLGHHHLHMPEEAEVLHVTQRYLEVGGLTVQGDWVASPDLVRPRYYGRVLATSGLN